MLGVIAGIDDAVGAGGNGGIDDETDAILGHADEERDDAGGGVVPGTQGGGIVGVGRIDGEIGRAGNAVVVIPDEAIELGIGNRAGGIGADGAQVALVGVTGHDIDAILDSQGGGTGGVVGPLDGFEGERAGVVVEEEIQIFAGADCGKGDAELGEGIEAPESAGVEGDLIPLEGCEIDRGAGDIPHCHRIGGGEGEPALDDGNNEEVDQGSPGEGVFDADGGGDDGRAIPIEAADAALIDAGDGGGIDGES